MELSKNAATAKRRKTMIWLAEWENRAARAARSLVQFFDVSL